MLQELGLPFREGDFEQGQRQVVGLHLRSALSQVLPLRDSAGLKPAFPIMHHASGRLVHLCLAIQF